MVQEYDEPGGKPEWLMQDARSESPAVSVRRVLACGDFVSYRMLQK
jgi:hypothetical protein